MKTRSFLNFDKMITPTIIKILFYLGLAMAILGGVVVFFGGIITAFQSDSFGAAFGGIIGGPLVTFFGVLLTRIYAELLIVVFQIHENLVAIKHKLVDGE